MDIPVNRIRMARDKLGCGFAILALDRRDQASVLRGNLI
jgi:hypothetical protein